MSFLSRSLMEVKIPRLMTFVLERALQHSRLHLGHRLFGRPPRVQRNQPGKALCVVCARPAGDEGVIASELGSNVHAAFAINPQQHSARSARQCSTAVPLADHRLKFVPLLARQHDSSHASHSEAKHPIAMIQWT